MTKKPLIAAVAALGLAVPAVALAQEGPATPDTTPPTAKLRIDTTLNSVDSLLGNGLSFSADPSEDTTWTAKATFRVGKRTYVVAKSVRVGNLLNQSGDFVEFSIPRGSDRAVKQLVQVKKGRKIAVTLTMTLTDTAGNRGTATKTVKLKKRY